MLNRQNETAIRARPLLRRLESALPLLSQPLPPGIDEVTFVLIDRATMRQVHADFLGDPTETDVITFSYGEVLVCPAVALERAAEFGHGLEQELLLYCLHGLLHLTGLDDTTRAKAKVMEKAQTELLKKVLRSHAKN